MANVQYTENLTEEQLDAMAGSETLRYQATSFGVTWNNKVSILRSLSLLQVMFLISWLFQWRHMSDLNKLRLLESILTLHTRGYGTWKYSDIELGASPPVVLDRINKTNGKIEEKERMLKKHSCGLLIYLTRLQQTKPNIWDLMFLRFTI